MRYLLLFPMLLLCATLVGQSDQSQDASTEVVIDNDELKAIRYTSVPRGDVCGAGMHHHDPHMTVVLTDAKVRMTSEDGTSQEVEVAAGTSIWFEAETHSVINSGDGPTKMILIFPKG